MHEPDNYGWFHILSLALMAGLTVALCLRGKDWNAKQVRRFLLWTSVLVIVLEVYKQINYTFGNGSGEPYYRWYAFPWQFCSTPMYIGLLAGLTRKGWLHEALCSYLATFALFAGVAVMLYPEQVFVPTLGINIQTMVCHGSMVVIGIYLLASGYVKLAFKTVWKALPLFVALVLVAVVMNEAAYQVGLLENHNFNMFMISPYCDPSLPVYSLVQQVLPFPWSLAVYVLGFTSLACLMIALGKAVRSIYRGHRKTQYHSECRYEKRLHC